MKGVEREICLIFTPSETLRTRWRWRVLALDADDVVLEDLDHKRAGVFSGRRSETREDHALVIFPDDVHREFPCKS